MVYLFQFFQNTIVDAILLEVDADSVDHLVDDVLVNGTDSVVGHGDCLDWSEVTDGCASVWSAS